MTESFVDAACTAAVSLADEACCCASVVEAAGVTMAAAGVPPLAVPGVAAAVDMPAGVDAAATDAAAPDAVGVDAAGCAALEGVELAAAAVSAPAPAPVPAPPVACSTAGGPMLVGVCMVLAPVGVEAPLARLEGTPPAEARCRYLMLRSRAVLLVTCRLR